MRSFTDSDLSDTNNIVLFENSTSIDRNEKNSEQIDHINKKLNKIAYSMGLPEVPTNSLCNWLMPVTSGRNPSPAHYKLAITSVMLLKTHA